MQGLLRRSLVALLLAGCGGGTDPGWIHLARGFHPEAGVESGWFRTEIPAADWKTGSLADSWSCETPFLGGVRAIREQEVRLEAGGRTFDRVRRGTARRQGLRPGQFMAQRRSIVLRTEPGAGPPGDARFAMALDLGRSEEGVWRTEVGGHVAEAIPLWPGARETVRLTVSDGSALRFAAVASALGQPRPDDTPLALSVLQDGEELLRMTLRAELDPRARWTTLLLPRGGATELAFELEGEGGWAALLCPVVGPAAVEEVRRGRSPDVVLFLADTFRADNVALYGGAPETTPHLNRLLGESLRFRSAWAPAPWTLPSQISMLTGRYPPAHGGVTRDVGLTPALTTVAEQLSRFGYRTGGISDSGIVSRVFGFDHGFHWFREIPERRLERTLEAAASFLAAGDGRPTFLFVQTYRTHHPYRLGDEESETAFRALTQDEAYQKSGVPAPLARDLLDLYRRASGDLDRALDVWLGGLEDDGYFENGHLIFTSDHGEAFLEHGRMGHGDALWDEMLRVPLFLRGPGLPARTVELGASLVDLPATIAALTGVPPAPDWRGGSLLTLAEERPLLAFERDEVALVAGTRKLLGRLPEDGDPAGIELLAAYDLAADPGERTNLLDSDAVWPEELARTLVPLLREAARDAVSPAAVEVGDEHEERLRALGYAE